MYAKTGTLAPFFEKQTQSRQKIIFSCGDVIEFEKSYKRTGKGCIYIWLMMFSRSRIILLVGVSALLLNAGLNLVACGSDSSSSSEEYPDTYSSEEERSSSSAKVSLSSSSAVSGNSSSGGAVASSSSFAAKSSASTETTSSDEILNEPQKAISGTCAPTKQSVEKGELAEWKFYRAEGDVFAQITAPFVWAFEGATVTNVQGNGLDKVNVRYTDAGAYAAYLNVDGNDVLCDTIQVQGIPISVNSCKPSVSTAKAGEAITWTVDAESESPITGYVWTSSYGEVSGSGASGSMMATSAMHKQSVTATVAVSNADNSIVKYVCDGVAVVDPESVDLVLELGSINDADKYGETVLPGLPDSLFIPAQTATTVQVPAGAPSGCTIGCKPKTGSDYEFMQVFWDSDEALSGFAYFAPAGCAPGKKYTVTTTVTAICVVNK